MVTWKSRVHDRIGVFFKVRSFFSSYIWKCLTERRKKRFWSIVNILYQGKSRKRGERKKWTMHRHFFLCMYVYFICWLPVVLSLVYFWVPSFTCFFLFLFLFCWWSNSNKNVSCQRWNVDWWYHFILDFYLWSTHVNIRYLL